jgi:hypothetical protein
MSAYEAVPTVHLLLSKRQIEDYMKASTLLFMVASAIGLGACSSGEPSSSEMQRAVEATVRKQINSARAMMGNSPQARKMFPEFKGLESFNKLSCVTANAEPGHICDFQMIVNGATQAAKGRFYKGTDGYLFEERN